MGETGDYMSIQFNTCWHIKRLFVEGHVEKEPCVERGGVGVGGAPVCGVGGADAVAFVAGVDRWGAFGGGVDGGGRGDAGERVASFADVGGGGFGEPAQGGVAGVLRDRGS